ncbi:MAG TPA: hypothetical protein DHV60_07575 [Verrucomicrobiales bacterium]|nr:hypothetical protein [Verrucomicrobiales bacterium]
MKLFINYKSRFIKSCAIFTATLVMIISSFPVAAAYRPPDLEKELFAASDIKLNKFDRAGLVGALVSVARDFNKEDNNVEFNTRSYALAIAARIDKDNSKVKDILEQLKESGKSLREENAAIEKSARRLYSGVRALMRKKDNTSNLKCAAYCVDIALMFDPEGKNTAKFKELASSLKGNGYKVSWKGILKSPISHNTSPYGSRNKFTKVERLMPGGDAKEFALKQSRIIGLSVRQLPNGKHAGAANAVIITALEEEDQEDLLFKFDQNVGKMMAGSLEDIIKFMRVRHNKTIVPTGYLVDITLGDKNGLVDGPSAGTAFALVIDSLFTGDKIDPKYACTGTMSADGQTGVIGGVAGKIRGAINKDCTIVGIPLANAKGVWDSFLLDGIGSLLKINVFTQKNFEEAHNLSRMKKASELIDSIAIYEQVANLVSEKGKDSLKHPEVKKKLKAVLEKSPNHLCAKVLLDFANGKHVRTLSLRGSFDEINMELAAFGRGLDEGSSQSAKESVEHLNEIQDMIDSRVLPYLKESMILVTAIRNGKSEGEELKDFSKRIGNLFRNAIKAKKKIMEDPKIVEEMTL